MAKIDLGQMERDILEAADKQGQIGLITGSGTPASNSLYEKYSSFEAREQLLSVTQYLLEQRYLMPSFEWEKGSESRYFARSLTPKGLERLRDLRCPIRAWVCKNWFPVMVAFITASIGIGSIGVELYLNWD